MGYYRKIPVPVVAVQWRGDNMDEVRAIVQPLLRDAWGDWQQDGPWFACLDDDWDGSYNTCQFYWNGDDMGVDPGQWMAFTLDVRDHPHYFLQIMSDAVFRGEIEWVE